MSEITDWEPLEVNPETDWEEKYAQQILINGRLIVESEKLKAQNQELIRKNASLLSDLKELQEKFICFKADAITSLKAIDLCILATTCTNGQWLTHRQRNFRMRHIHQIILNEVASLGDRKLITYEDDF